MKLLFLFLGLPVLGMATELSPWYPEIFQVQPAVEYISQRSDTIASSHGDFNRRLNANFLHGSIGIAYYKWYGEAELLLAEDTQRSFGYDNFATTVRYHLTDDVPGYDFLSSVIGLTVNITGRQALDDLSSFHHGKLESMLHFSVGKEFSCNEDWSSRLWSVFGVGCADEGSPWMFLRLSSEKKYCLNHQFRIGVDGLYGFGGDALSKHKSFRGYGPIAHRSIDLYGTYSYTFVYGSKATFGGSYRLFAYNYPKNAYSLFVSFLYPFGL